MEPGTKPLIKQFEWRRRNPQGAIEIWALKYSKAELKALAGTGGDSELERFARNVASLRALLED
jgi:hypothetical protein